MLDKIVILLTFVVGFQCDRNLQSWNTIDYHIKDLPNKLQDREGCFEWESTVSCYGKQVDSLPVAPPNGTTTLQILVTSIRNFTKGMFTNYTEIKKLYIVINPLDVIENGAIEELVKLKELAFVLCDLNNTDFDPAIFQKLPQLEMLNLQSNSLNDISQLQLGHLMNLKYLDLSYNGINGMDEGILPQTLILLNLVGNNFTTLDSSIYEGLPSLNYLDLRGNKIKEFKTGLCGKSESLETVYLNENNLKSSALHGAFDNCNSMKNLNLSDNAIEDLKSDTLMKMKLLQNFSIAYNELQLIPSDALRSLTFLQHLDLSGNFIKMIENDAFRDLKSLKVLKLLSMKKELNIEINAFNGLNKLTSLDLSFTQLNNDTQTDIFRNLTNLQKINLRKCSISTLVGDIFMTLPSLEELDISENPLICDCDLVWMVQAVEANKTWAKKWGSFTASPKCYFPKHLREEPIETFLPTDLTCSKPIIKPITSTDIILGAEEDLVLKANMIHGLPSSKWILPSGDEIQLPDGEVKKGISASEKRQYNHTVRAMLEVSHHNITYSGAYTLEATNIAGSTNLTFYVTKGLPTSTQGPTNRLSRLSPPGGALFLLLLVVKFIR